MAASRTVLYGTWVIVLCVPMLVAATQSHGMGGEFLWLLCGGGAGVLSKRGGYALRVWVDVLVGLLFFGLGGWSVLHLCGITVTVALIHHLPLWVRNDLPVPRLDLFPALLHCFLGVMAFTCALQRPRQTAIHVVQAEH
jgi:hypothetical protein